MGTPRLPCSSLPPATSSGWTGSTSCPWPTKSAAVLPRRADDTPIQTCLFTGEPQTQGEEVAPGWHSRHGQLSPVLLGRGWLGILPSHLQATPLAQGKGRVTLQVMYFQRLGQ